MKAKGPWWLNGLNSWNYCNTSLSTLRFGVEIDKNSLYFLSEHNKPNSVNEIGKVMCQGPTFCISKILNHLHLHIKLSFTVKPL